MTQRELDTHVCMWKQVTQQGIENFELVVDGKGTYCDIKLVHKTIDFHNLPSCIIYEHHEPKEVSKILINFLELIYQNCDDWIEAEREDYDNDVDYRIDKNKEQ